MRKIVSSSNLPNITNVGVAWMNLTMAKVLDVVVNEVLVKKQIPTYLVHGICTSFFRQYFHSPG